MATVIFVLLSIINGAMLAMAEHGPDTWQYWVCSFCVCGAYISGWHVGHDC